MAFIVHTLTALGASMIASATTGNRMIISGCAVSENQYTENQALQLSLLPADARFTTNITLSSNLNVAEARATFLRSDGNNTGGNWYSMILFGRMQNQSISRRFPIAVIVSDAQFYIPELNSSISDVSVIFSLGFNINVNVIEVPVETIYALNSELLALRNVSVTTQNINDPSQGDDQYIKGSKFFAEAIGSDNGLETSEFSINGNDIVVKSSQFNEGGSSFEHIIAEVHDSTNGIFTGLYLERDNTDDYTLKSNAEHVYFPGLVSDRTDYYYIGCITLIAIYVDNVNPLVSNIAVGGIVEWIDSYCQLYAAKWDVSNHTFARDTSADLKNMRFKLMSSCDISKLGTSFALAMRVE